MTLQQRDRPQPSAQTMLGVNSRLASYQGNINSQQYQLAQMQAFANAQDKVFDQKGAEAGYCADLDLVNSTAVADGCRPECWGSALRCGCRYCRCSGGCR